MAKYFQILSKDSFSALTFDISYLAGQIPIIWKQQIEDRVQKLDLYGYLSQSRNLAQAKAEEAEQVTNGGRTSRLSGGRSRLEEKQMVSSLKERYGKGDGIKRLSTTVYREVNSLMEKTISN
ncbi:hypothetical protein L345_06884, partial [Ophiophagus hannah]